MIIKRNGAMSFDDVFELNYELLSQLEMNVRHDGTIFDPTTNNILAFNGMIIKASIKPNEIHYAGQGEIEFDILNNVRMITTLFGTFLDRKIKSGMQFRSYYPEERLEGEDIKSSSLTVKFDDYNSITTPFYHNKCLKFIHMIYALEEELVDLSNFDQIEEEENNKNTRR